jgi:hypothetical protein
MMDLSQLEDLIDPKLPFLNKFEFYTRSVHAVSEKETAESALDEMIAPFRTPFWTEEKRWLIICNFFPTRERLEMHTSPMFTSFYNHISDPQTMTISNRWNHVGGSERVVCGFTRDARR